MSPAHDADSEPDPDGDYPLPCLDADTLGDAAARERRTSGTALRARGSGRTYSYRDFVTTSYKAGNVLRHLGVRPGDEIQVASEHVPEPVLTFYGAAQLGAVTRFDTGVEGTPPRVAVAPATRESAFDLPPGHHLAVYGDPPTDPSVTHWEAEVWSENPAVHPVAVEGSDPLFAAEGRTYTHDEVVTAAADVVADAGIDPGSAVVLRGPLTDPAVVIAGVVAPILAGATVVLPDGRAEIAAEGAPIAVDGEPRRVSLGDRDVP
ncbi:AMP-binding protein [Halobellus ruber]|uniref:AMP-binding protein n=1 Tax=Halobellus ruber TaxID=2761102 RepID=A0A7J9SLV6_9EURY|nr:AMP-binding protein [Halobellus ruber]MBB6647944.1 AMP-binding protein [Halobellus ruber]